MTEQIHCLGCYCTISDLSRYRDFAEYPGFEFGFQRQWGWCRSPQGNRAG